MSASTTITKEIAKGIFLHKKQMQATGASDGTDAIYIFKIEVKSLQILDFTADFTGSENLTLDGSPNLISHTTIQPMSTDTVALLKLQKNWKLKSRFKFTMRNPPKEVQQKHLMPSLITLNN